jgi:hypothetical protein
MVTRLERDIQCCPLRFSAGYSECNNLGVWLSGPGMISLADYLTIENDHSADHRIWFGLTPAAPRELERVRHEALIGERIWRAVRIS